MSTIVIKPDGIYKGNRHSFISYGPPMEVIVDVSRIESITRIKTGEELGQEEMHIVLKEATRDNPLIVEFAEVYPKEAKPSHDSSSNQVSG